MDTRPYGFGSKGIRAFKNFAALLMPRTYRRLARVRAIARDHEWYHEELHRRELMRRAFKALKFNGITGDYAEFGVGGMTFSLAFTQSRKHGFDCKLWAFDSFEGLPEQTARSDAHPRWKPGAMQTRVDDFVAICEKNGMSKDDYTIVKGDYSRTLDETGVAQGSEFPSEIALAYIDCDLYTSTKAVLGFLASRMKHGTIVAFDDYFCFSDRDLSGERRACLEFLRDTSTVRFLPFVQFNWHGMSFIVEDTALHDEIEHGGG